MTESEVKAKRYRQQADACLEWAARMQLEGERIRMTNMAKQWLDIAKEIEATAAKGE